MLDEIKVDRILGDKIFLRELNLNDSEELLKGIIKSKKHLEKFLPWPRYCNSKENVEERIENWEMQKEMGRGLCLAILEKNTKKICGSIFLGWIEKKHFSASICYWLFSEYEGHGYATEALELLCGYCFKILKLNRLEINASTTNLKSIALAKRCKFKEEGISLEYEYLDGKFLDTMRLSRLARDF